MTKIEQYRSSLYTAVQLLHKTDLSTVEKVVSSLDGKEYVRKTYPADKREVFSLLAQLENPHIPKIAEIFFNSDTVVIEEYIPGKTLEQLIEENQSFSSAQIRMLTGSILDAMQALHSHGLIHRDIKPSNIIVRPDGEAVLIDYSIARVFSRGEDTHRLGTVGYAAPEQFGFSESDQRTDLYAFGVTMRQIITRKNASRGLRKAMERCTEFDPMRRFRDVRHLARRLRRQRWMQAAAAVLAAACLLAVALWPKKGKEEVTKHPEQQMEPAQTLAQSTVLYESVVERTIDTAQMQQELPCLMLEGNGNHEMNVTPGENAPQVRITVKKEDDVCTLYADGEELLTFGADDSFSVEAYPQGTLWADVMLYDLNGDGYQDLIPAVSHADRVQWMDGSVVMMRNYSLAWCVYYDGSEYRAARGRMEAKIDQLCLYPAVADAIFADELSCYKLIDGVLVQIE